MKKTCFKIIIRVKLNLRQGLGITWQNPTLPAPCPARVGFGLGAWGTGPVSRTGGLRFSEPRPEPTPKGGLAGIVY